MSTSRREATIVESWRPRFHVTPAGGRILAPNGVVMDGGRLHVFFAHDQRFPVVNSRLRWGHASVAVTPGPQGRSSQLKSEWRFHPDVLVPNHEYDRDGCLAGSAVRDDDGTVRLVYTGIVAPTGKSRGLPDSPGAEDSPSVRFSAEWCNTSVNMAALFDTSGRHGGWCRPHSHNPLVAGVESPPGTCGPFVFRDPDSPVGGWRMIVGSEREPVAHLYRSDNLRSWTPEGPLKLDISAAVEGDTFDIAPDASTWEYPNLLRMRDCITGEEKDVLVVSMRGVEPRAHHFTSSAQCVYYVGRLEGTTFHVERGCSELDLGHEFYAARLTPVPAEHEPSGNTNAGTDTDAVVDDAVLIAWAGLPEADDQPSADDGWIHCLTMPRRVRLCGGRLAQEFVTTASAAAAVASGAIDSGIIPETNVYGTVIGVRRDLPEPSGRLHLEVVSADGVHVDVDLMRNKAGDVLVRIDRNAQSYHDGPDVRGVMILSEAIENYRRHMGRSELLLSVDGSIMEVHVAGYTLTSRLFLARGDHWVEETWT
ncbi:glycoside hydrolase family 32 protein [Corynebacterium kroppenstedtii]|uniref:glycoside hydrolase family 32 protein n=1 Tax=Corynebacterium sp. PCR 32 TaxID=3351342 RepID=UPI0030ACA4B5